MARPANDMEAMPLADEVPLLPARAEAAFEPTGDPVHVLEHLLSRFDPSVLDGLHAKARLRLGVEGEGEWDVLLGRRPLRLESAGSGLPDATLAADRVTWTRIAEDLHGGMDAWREGRLVVRRNLHLGVSFLAATSGMTGPERLTFRMIPTASGPISTLAAGSGDPVLLVHGLGATKVSFLTTAVALAGSFRTISLDLPGFGDSVKPVLAPYHPPFFARAIVDLMDALNIERAHVIGNSMGGRIALELGLRHPDRVRDLVLVAPSLAWKRERPWAPLVRLFRPEIGFLQATPRWVFESVLHRLIPAAADTWVRAGVDEFLRAYTTPRGRVAFYASARNIYLEEPHGAKGFWTRLAGMEPRCLFVWGELDKLVPIGFARHVEDTLPSSQHLRLDCGHVPQLERPEVTHAAIESFLRSSHR
ncbi:alpha/beta fold hydrolase [bacterium]|nr:alpha/beta fold hydrolase [bacterium]